MPFKVFEKFNVFCFYFVQLRNFFGDEEYPGILQRSYAGRLVKDAGLNKLPVHVKIMNRRRWFAVIVKKL